MSTKPSLEEIQDRLRGALASPETPDLAAAYLFGSTARGSRRPTSDVDLGVLFRAEPPQPGTVPFDALEAELTDAVGLPVQLVVMNDAPADLVHRVLRDGILLLQPDRSARVRFEVAKRNEYFDLLPILRRYRRWPPEPGPVPGAGQDLEPALEPETP